MSRIALSLALCSAFISLPAVAAPDSLYTDLGSKACKVLKALNSDGGTTSRCPAVGGYQLLIEAGDIRESITLVDPRGQLHPLDLWSTVSGAPSRVGPKAEWRVTRQNGKVTPQALIVRYIVTPYDEKTGGYKPVVSYLAVAKIGAQATCVIASIPTSADANEQARAAAVSAADKACLKP